MVEFFSRLLRQRRGITGSPIYRLAYDVATRRMSWEQALHTAQSYQIAAELSDGDLIELDRQAAFEAQTNLEFALLLERLTVAAARSKSFEKVYVDLALNLVEMLERAGLEDERDYYLNEALHAAQRVSYQSGYRSVLNRMARYASLEHNDADARRYLAEQLAIGREDNDTRDDVDTAILIADMALIDGDRTTAYDLYQRASQSGKRLGYDSAVVAALLKQAQLVTDGEDYESAERLLRSAEEIAGRTADDRLQARVALRLGEMQLRNGNPEAAIEQLEIALKQAEIDDDLMVRAEATSGLATAMRDTSQRHEAMQRYRTLVDLELQAGNRRQAGDALVELSNLYLEVGRFDEALSSLAQAREMAFSSGDRRMSITVHGLLGTVLVARGDERGALEAFDVAVSESRDIDDIENEVRWLLGAAEAMLRFSGPAEARPVVDRVRRLARRLGDVALEAQAEGLHGQIALVDGRLGDAMRAFGLAERMSRDSGNVAMSLHYLPILARLAIEDEDNERASQYLEQINEQAPLLQDARSRCRLYGQVASIHNRLGDTEAAIESYRLAGEASAQAGDQRLELRALQGLAVALDRSHQDLQALDTYRRALDLAQRLHDRPSQARLHFNAGALLMDLQRDDEARSHLLHARDTAEASGDLELADRADDLLSQIAPPGAAGFDIQDDLPIDEGPAPPRSRDRD